MAAMAGMFLMGSRVFQSFGVGTVLVVAIAIVGSLTVLPAVLSKLGDRVDRGRLPFVHRPAGREVQSRLWPAIVGEVLRRPLVWGGLAAGAPGRARDPGVPPAHRELGRPGASPRPARDAGLRAHGEGVPRPAASRGRRRQRARRHVSVRSRRGSRRSSAPPLATGAMSEPTTVDVSALAPRRPGADLARREGHGRGLGPRARRSSAARSSRGPSVACRVWRSHTTGLTADSRDFNDSMKSHAPYRVRVGPRAGVRVAARHVPLDRDPAQGNRPEHALGRLPPTACSCSCSRTAGSSHCSASSRSEA